MLNSDRTGKPKHGNPITFTTEEVSITGDKAETTWFLSLDDDLYRCGAIMQKEDMKA